MYKKIYHLFSVKSLGCIIVYISLTQQNNAEQYENN